jgi:hypothetical protein
MRTTVTASTKAILTSFKVSHTVAEDKKLHTIGKTLLFPARIKTCRIKRGEKCAEALRTIPHAKIHGAATQ